MQLHQIQANTKFRRGQRIGRGGKRGTTSGRGTKGQKARAGHKIRPAIRDIMKKFPKLRGYRFKSFRVQPVILNVKDFTGHFAEGETVSPATLLAKGLIAKRKGRIPQVKILGTGEAKKKFVFKDVLLSHALAAKMKG